MVINHSYWLKRFHGAADVVDRKVQFNDQAFTIIGVLPRNAQLDTASPVFIPIIATAADRENHFVTRESADVIGRLKPGISVVEATSEMEILASAIAAEFPVTDKGRGVRITSLLEQTVATTGGYGMKGASALLFLLSGAVGVLLLIACVNIANLLLARASTRRKEIAVRAALGATGTRIVRQLLCESLLLAALGGSLGAMLAYWGLDLLKPLTGYLPRAGEISLDGRALAFSSIVTLLTGIGFGLVPAWHSMQTDVLNGMKDGGRGNAGRRSQRLRSTFIITEVALALMLLTGAGLLIKSFIHLQQVELGFQTEGIYGNRFELPPKKYGTSQQQVAFVDQVTERITGLSEVSSAAFTTGMPVFGSLGGAFKIAGRPDEPNAQMRGVLYAATTPDYFRTIGIPIIRGRAFSSHDTVNAPRVVIISASVAEKYFAGQDPIGQRISRVTRTEEREAWLEIVGVVGDVKQWGPASDTIREKPEGVYEPFAQNPTTLNLLLVVRTTASKTDLPNALRLVIQSVDTDMPLTRMFHLADGVNESISRYRLSMFILALFAGIAVLLAAIGVYGVMAYAVTQRTHEIGVRMAIGAQRGDILRLVFSQAGKLVGIGLVVGLAGSLAGSRLLRALLFEVSPQDPATFVAVALMLVGATFVACWLPARRAARVDPMVALRCE
jgi:putative ABC transport system permease protein